MEHTLSELTLKYGNKGIPVANYATLIGIRKNFSISANNFGDFFKGYCELSYKDECDDEGEGIPPSELYIGEVIGNNRTTLPLMGRFRFKFQVEEGEEERSYYGEELPMKIVKCYQKAMGELLNISSGMSEYICCIQEGHSYRKGDFVCIDLLLQFPFCQVDIKYIKKTFKPYIEKILRQQRVIESFDTHPVGDWKDHMMDVGDIIPLYRSSYEQNIPHLMLTHIYGLVKDSHIEEVNGPEISLREIFNPSTFSLIYNGKIPVSSIPEDPEDGEDEDEFARFWAPLFLSIEFWSGQTLPVETEKEEYEYKKGPYNVSEADSENPLRMSMSLLPLLSVERANQDYSWLDIGRVLFKITKGSEEGLSMWINFSSRATVQGRDRDMCIYRYPELKGSLLTIATIAWYAKQDNPEGYDEWHTGWCNKALNDCLSSSHADVAKAIYRVFWLNYIYSGETQNWYEYRENHFYKIGKEPIPLRKEIVSKFVKIFYKMSTTITKNSAEDDSETGVKKDVDFKVKAINDLILKLKNENYRSTIVKACKDNFHIEEFERKCDKNHLLTAIGNCVLEVVDKKVRPRPGKPEDYVLKCSDMIYQFDYTWDSHWVKEVMYWFDQITVNDRELKHYFLKRISSFLRGLNPEKLFDVWTNSGNNSKSMLMKTLQKIYGSYFVDFPVSLLNIGSGKNAGSASPELAQAANARAAVLAEPDDRASQLSSGMIKRLTGGDRIFTRSLHENGGSMDLTFKTIMVCNRIPTLASVDKATINRFVIMPFLGTWSEDAPESEEEQFKLKKFKLDPFFEAKIPELAKALLWVSVQYYPYYANEGLLFPPIVKEYIKKHWDDNDHYLQFIAEKIEYAYKDNDKKDINTDVNITAQDLYKFFTPWFKDYFPGVNVPTLSEFRDDLSMSGRLGPQPRRGVWLGIKMKNIVPDLGGLGTKL